MLPLFQRNLMQAILPPIPLVRMTHRQRETPFVMAALFPSMGLQARLLTTEALSTTLTLIWPHRRRRATVPPILALLIRGCWPQCLVSCRWLPTGAASTHQGSQGETDC